MKIKKLNKLEKFIATARFRSLGKDKWYPFPYLGDEHIIDKQHVFEENLVVNYTSTHDGYLLGARYHVSKTLIEQGLWNKKSNIGIYVINDRRVGHDSRCLLKKCEYKLYYLE